jgi:hypothetical protein
MFQNFLGKQMENFCVCVMSGAALSCFQHITGGAEATIGRLLAAQQFGSRNDYSRMVVNEEAQFLLRQKF